MFFWWCFQCWWHSNNSSSKCLAENLRVFVVLRKVFPHKLDEQFTNTCFHILAILWGDPCNLSVSISSSVLRNAIIKRHWWKMSTILHCSFIDRFNFAKLFLITGWISNSLIDLLSELFDDCRWVVRKVADLEWCIVILSNRKVFLCRKFERNI